MKDEQIWKRYYEAAIAFRDLKPWEWMYDEELFGVEDPDTGQTNYCCIMGNAGEYIALGLYLGEEGLKSYLLLTELAEELPFIDQMGVAFNQNMLKVEYTDRDELTDIERKQIKGLGLKFRGKNQWVLGRYQPPHSPGWPIEAEHAKILTHALEQAVDVCRRAKDDKEFLYGPEEEMLIRKPGRDGDKRIWEDQYEENKEFDVQPFPVISPDQKLVNKAKKELSQEDAALLLMYQYSRSPVLDDEKKMIMPRIAFWLGYPEAMIIGNDIITPDNGLETLEQSFFNLLHNLEFIPRQIGFNSVMGYRAFLELAEALDIEMLFMPEEPVFEEVKQSMPQFF